MRVAILGVALIVCGLIVGTHAGGSAPTAEASFHEMRIYGVMGGKGDTPSAQFVELRMASGGQNQVQHAQLCFFDADGLPWARFVFPSMVPNAGAQGSILIASGAMNAEWQAGGAVADFIFSSANTTALNPSADVNAPIKVPNGAVVYKGNSDTTCTSATAIDSIAYGTAYNGVTLVGDPQHYPHTDLPISGSQGFQLQTTPVTFPPTDNDAEYELVDCIAARNNEGASGTIGAECGGTATPTPSPIPTATPTDAPSDTPVATPTDTPPATATATPSTGALQGDADCDGNVDEDDAVDILEEEAGLGNTECQERGDVNCDTNVDVLDALALFKYAADLGTASAGCTPIGEPLEA